MCEVIRLKGPCQAGATRLNESRERGAIDVAEFFFLHQAIAESSTDPKSGDRYV